MHFPGTRILVVDDEPTVRDLLVRLLTGKGYAAVPAASAKEAARRLAEEEFALMLCDVGMPGESGLVLTRRVLREHAGVAVVMVTGVDDPKVAEIALANGAYGFVIKPFKHNELLINVANALRRRALELESRARREGLEEMIFLRTAALHEAIAQLRRSEGELRHSREETIRRLAAAVESRQREIGGHIERVTRTAGLIAERLGLPVERCELIASASALHDVGKIAIPDSILLKPGPLAPGEEAVMRRHAELGYEMLSGSGSEPLELAAAIAWTHHERFGGGGYPRGLRGEAIPLEGRIVAVADVFDALTSDRVYRPAFPVAEAVRLLREGRGTHFDPLLLDVFLASLDEIVALRDELRDGLAA